MNYNNITTCDIVNGSGIGVVLWVSGCDLRCPGCQNPCTHDFLYGTRFSEQTEELLIKELSKSYITRLTISGGHPLAKDNLSVTTKFCKKIKQLLPDINIWIYTGYIYEDIQDYEILNYIDVLVDGPFILEQRDISLPFRGSKNQRLIDLKRTKKSNEVVLYEIDK